MRRSLAVLSLLLALVFAGVGPALVGLRDEWPTVLGTDGGAVLSTLLLGLAVLFGAFGLYVLVMGAVRRTAPSKRRAHDARNVLRFVFGIATGLALLGVLTEQWVGVLFSLGIVGVAVTFALQQPLFSLIGWLYITIKRPYQVGDRVRIEDARGDVIEIDFLVTTLWEINGELVSSNQPSGRTVTLPNSTVLSSQVYNYSWAEFPYIWNEISVQVAYETDLEFAREQMAAVADDYLGDEMEENIKQYRSVLAETPVELEVRERPSVNVVQHDSWVELQLRYLVDSKEGQRTKNQLYERVLDRFNEHPDRISFPLGRNR